MERLTHFFFQNRNYFFFVCCIRLSTVCSCLGRPHIIQMLSLSPGYLIEWGRPASGQNSNAPMHEITVLIVMDVCMYPGQRWSRQTSTHLGCQKQHPSAHLQWTQGQSLGELQRHTVIKQLHVIANDMFVFTCILQMSCGCAQVNKYLECILVPSIGI